MVLQSIAMKAYSSALESGSKIQRGNGLASELNKSDKASESFAETIQNSLREVNEMENQKSGMIEAFASGEQQNVHELMISLQKAGVAVSMTSAVRNKVLESYRELMRIQF